MKPQYGELAFILSIGALQPAFEMLWGTQIATYYNAAAAIIVIVYITFRAVRSGMHLFRDWGLRFDNFWQCLPPYLLFVVIAGIVLYGYGWMRGNTLPVAFWYVLALYPLWGVAQQFVLQNFIAENLVHAVPSLTMRSLITATLFACAHIPSAELAILTFIAGFCFTYLYHFYRNLFALGIAHGILGALVFHLILGQNQWEILVRYFS
ncbi:MAG TPA: hypothetical protein DEB30_00605 [Candidatus Peribacter riflensis]|uniref:CAAX prenyl protease 2/Lysostaphin resistance protein A-like domain-containing protein n=1 Tax=Candidatus Peribacter riflensis TaxID=1735162 RepID=A0A0S1SII6_9BACT|nr:MAG: hypothetical protein PeribacterA2_0304 [Candidatus Peribacter riflensis]OGJ78271.1 MAG: hypothetical protein A2398_05275 [Candidatus Peribacteria bacterium RIFOXYB1_FULL_57_12]ALM10798.1 MAG: hypothetical protein PeribacterB2_0304 [Candidatus Peribacter riflensis]ALM11900.1 MAG: hypothetical protein PeribacterC2_0303 [Candidatus Peribacter riflensis]ALM13003.1 MAG: hypothetical protein PeribacterD1_0304 [Candidatus Peribacter riflensis]